jgi:MoxR-like ATPase
LQEFTRQVPIANDIRSKAVDVVMATRNHEDLKYGASPRASMSIVLAAKARAIIEGRNHVSTEDVEEVAKPVLRHRVGLSFQAEKSGKTEDDVTEEILEEV